MTTELPNKLCSGSHKATEEEGDYGIGEQIWSQKWRQQDSSKLEEDGGGSSRENSMEKSGLWPTHY